MRCWAIRQALIPAGEWRPLSKRLIGFPVVQLLVGEQDGFLHLLLALLVWITLVLVPLWMMLWLLIGYLPAQDESVLAWQRVALTLDAFAGWPQSGQIGVRRNRESLLERHEPRADVIVLQAAVYP